MFASAARWYLTIFGEREATALDEGDFVTGMLAVVHETGHALYERGLPAAWRWQPGGDAAGSAMHEGQALLWEMVVGRSRALPP